MSFARHPVSALRFNQGRQNARLAAIGVCANPMQAVISQHLKMESRIPPCLLADQCTFIGTFHSGLAGSTARVDRNAGYCRASISEAHCAACQCSRYSRHARLSSRLASGRYFFVNQGVYPLDWAPAAAADSLAFEDRHTAQCPLVIAPYGS
jgi:hypothetical protein